MVEDDLSDVVGGHEEIGFKLTFERKECIRVSDGHSKQQAFNHINGGPHRQTPDIQYNNHISNRLIILARLT